MPSPPEVLNRLPFARGLTRLAASLSPVFRRDGVAPRRERVLILAAVVSPIPLAIVAGPWSTIAGIVFSVALLFTILRGRALHLHGAEHRAIAAAEEHCLSATWEGAAKPSRYSPRCGTNFAALALPVTFLADRAAAVCACVLDPGRRSRLLPRTDDGDLAARAALAARLLARISAAGPRVAAPHDP